MGVAQNLRQRRLRFRNRRQVRRAGAPMTLMEHLGELRSRLIIAAATFFLFSIAAFGFFNPISDFLLRPLCLLPAERLGPQGCELIITAPMEAFLVRLKVTAMVGIVASSPVWLYQLWAFIVPGLTSKERGYAMPFVLSSTVLFGIGAVFAYLTLPTGLRFLISLGGDNFVPFFRAEEYLNFIGLMLFAFGLTFELPLVLFFLGLVGVVSVEMLRKQRKVAVVAIAALAAVVTPSQDPYTLLVMAVPLYGLYELTILLLSVIKRRRRRAESQGS